MVKTSTAWPMCLVLLLACAPPDMPVQTGSRALDGVWRLELTEVLTPDGQRISRPSHESFLLFAGDYYSMNWAGGESPAPFSAERLRPTDAEKIARYGSVIVNAGRFEMSETELTISPDFALVPEYVGGVGEFDYALVGDTLDLEWHTILSADGVPDPSTAAGVRFHYRWSRR